MSGVICIVLGMHKSGTTLVSRLLHASGIPMLDGEAEGAYDQGRYYERTSTLAINRELLAGCYLPPLRQLWKRGSETGEADDAHSLSLVKRRAIPDRVPPPLAARMRVVIAACGAGGRAWGFKDPRTCLTYPLWRAELPPHRLVIVYRGWNQLLERYRVLGWKQLNLPRLLRVLDAWAVHNARILGYLRERQVPALVLRYEAMMDGDLELARLEGFVGRRLEDVREPERYRHRRGTPAHRLPAARLLAPLLRESPATVLLALDAARREQLEGTSESVEPGGEASRDRVDRSAREGAAWTSS